MEISIAILTVFCLASMYSNYIMLKKQEKYEEQIDGYSKQIDELEKFIQNFSDNLTAVDLSLKTIDQRGTFQADDEVGYTFKTIQLIMSHLQQFNANLNGEKTQ